MIDGHWLVGDDLEVKSVKSLVQLGSLVGHSINPHVSWDRTPLTVVKKNHSKLEHYTA